MLSAVLILDVKLENEIPTKSKQIDPCMELLLAVTLFRLQGFFGKVMGRSYVS